MQRTYDPIATSSTTLSTDTDEREVFAAPGLRLIAVDWAWALALKFVRYAKHDPEDVYVQPPPITSGTLPTMKFPR